MTDFNDIFSINKNQPFDIILLHSEKYVDLYFLEQKRESKEYEE